MDSLDVDVLFPESSATNAHALDTSIVERCFKELEKSELTYNQQLAVKSMLDPSLKQVMGLLYSMSDSGQLLLYGLTV